MDSLSGAEGSYSVSMMTGRLSLSETGDARLAILELNRWVTDQRTLPVDWASSDLTDDLLRRPDAIGTLSDPFRSIIFGDSIMRRSIFALLLLFPGYMCSETVLAAEFPYSVDTSVNYQGSPPADGKFLRENFLVSATPHGVAPKNLTIFVDLTTGRGGPVIQHGSCGVGEIQPGWTVTYGGMSCNWPDVIQVPQGERLFAAVSTAFGPFGQTEPPSTTEVKVERVEPFPDAGATNCQIPKMTPVALSSGSNISLKVYQLKGAVAQDGKLDQNKICVVAVPHGQEVVGLRLWGALKARGKGKETYVGSYLCIIRNAPDTALANEPVVCAIQDNNDVPRTMYVLPADAELYVASTVTFGYARSVPVDPSPVQTYGPR
jgi:hypothetical protein